MSDTSIAGQTKNLLHDLQKAMIASSIWSSRPPEESAFNSTAPFSCDTMPLEQWLQFIFMPTMEELVDRGAPLPSEIAVLPIAEESFQGQKFVDLLSVIAKLDNLLSCQTSEPETIPVLDILYQDEYIVAIHKPAGLLVHRSMIDKHETRFAMQLLRDQIGQHVYPVHRLDRPTSGVLVFALSSDIARILTEQFTLKQVEKTYFAIVRGHAEEKGRVDYALKEKLDKIADKKAKQDKPAQAAVTDYQTLTKFELDFPVGRYQSARYSLLKLTPITGRKHQLRRHMSHINHPILGDTTHGDGKHNKFARQQFQFEGLALTCQKLVLTHPVSEDKLEIHTNFDERMAKLLKDWDLTPSQLKTLI